VFIFNFSLSSRKTYIKTEEITTIKDDDTCRLFISRYFVAVEQSLYVSERKPILPCILSFKNRNMVIFSLYKISP
jgi:hypothetical protein